jgi:diguanylate cyclase (GGDEF)-like protein
MPVPVLLPHQSPSSWQRKLRQLVSELSMFQTVVIGVAGIALSASLDLFLDRYLAYDFPHTSVYMLPVGFAAWAGGFPIGVMLALIAAVAEVWVTYTTSEPNSSLMLGSLFVLELVTLLAGSYLLSKLRYLHEEEKQLSRTDQLTGLANGRSFWETVEQEIERMRRDPKPLTMMFIDVDDFKRINDRYGHREGDRMLKLIASSLAGVTRAVDSTARLGGDEFVAILPGADAAAAKSVVERLRYALTNADTHPDVRPTVSVGLATFLTPPNTTEALLHAADMLMYEAKTSGKDRVATRTY